MQKRPHLLVASGTSAGGVLEIAPQQKAVDPLQNRSNLIKVGQRREQSATLLQCRQACQIRSRAGVQRIQRIAVPAFRGRQERLRIALVGIVAGNGAYESFLRVLVQVGERVGLLDELSPLEESFFLGGSERSRGVCRESSHERDHQQPGATDVAGGPGHLLPRNFAGVSTQGAHPARLNFPSQRDDRNQVSQAARVSAQRFQPLP